MTVRDNVAAVADLIAKVRTHPMCAKFTDDIGNYTVIFPNGDFPVDGVRVSKRMGHAKALHTLIDRIESIWMESYP